MRKYISSKIWSIAAVIVLVIAFSGYPVQAAGAVNLYVVPAISNTKILPGSSISSSYLSSQISMAAAPGQYQAASFVVQANQSLGSLLATATDLVGSSGTISASNLDISAVKCWYKGGYDMSIGAYGRYLTPDLLLKDDSLVKVTGSITSSATTNDSSGSNSLKLTNGSYINISQTAYLDGSPTIIPISSRPIQDSSSLQPLSLSSGSNKQYWVVLKVPAGAGSGSYSGTINLINAGTNVGQLSVQLQVLPFQLASHGMYYGFYYKGRLNSSGSISSETKNATQMQAEMVDMARHGLVNPEVFDQDSLSTLSTIASIRQQAGISNNPFFTTAGYSSYSATLNAIAPYGGANIYIYGMYDEARPAELPGVRSFANSMHAAGFKVYAAFSFNYLTRDQIASVADVIDIAIVNGPPNASLADAFHSYGHQILNYANPQPVPEFPRLFRQNYGLLLWQNNYDGSMDYAYQIAYNDIWNDFDNYGGCRDFVYSYPTANGVIDTLLIEGVREGISDVRYIKTLQNAITSAKAQGKDTSAAANWLANLKQASLDNLDLDAVRSQMITYILSLNGSSLPPAPSPAPTSTSTPTYSTPNVVANWKFDQGSGTVAADSAGSNTGTIYSGTWTSGISGSALSFNGSSTYVDCGTGSSLNLTGPLSLEAWIKVPSAPTGDRQIIQKGPVNWASENYYLELTPQMTVRFGIGNGSTFNSVLSSGSTPVLANTWSHVVGVADGSTLKIYLNGVLQGTATQTISPASNSTSLKISVPYSGLGFSGVMDDVNIFNTALSQSVIQSRYAARGGSSTPTPSPSPTPSPTTSSANAIANWKFDQGSGTVAADSAGSNTGTIYSGTWTSGISGSALSFNGSSTYVDCGTGSSLNLTGPLSLEAWIKVPSAPTGDRQIIQKGPVNWASENYYLELTPQMTVRFGIGNGSTFNSVLSSGSTPVLANTWSHVVGVADGSTLKIYLNGVLQGTATQTISPASNSTSLKISVPYSGLGFSGVMDDVNIFNTALSQSVIQSRYAARGGSSTPTPSPSPTPSPTTSSANAIANWKFDQGSGTVAADSAGSNTGTIYSGTWTSGISGSALSFNGSSTYVDCGTGSSLNLTGPLSLEAWIKVPSAPTGDRQIIQKGPVNWASENYYLELTPQMTVRFGIGNGSTFNSVLSSGSAPVLANTWYRVVGVANGSTLKIYLNGVLQGTATQTISPASNSTSLKISVPYAGLTFNGIIDEVSIYNTAITP